MKSDAQRFTEMTGVCWHERDWSKEPSFWVGGNGWQCFTCRKCGQNIPIDYDSKRPTYSNPKDILEKMKEFCGEDRYYEFIIHISFVQTGSSNVGFIMSIGDFINTYILNPPLLLKKAIEFLEGEK
jgi:hypothetical protein